VILRGVDWRVLAGGSALGAAMLALCVALPADGVPLTYVRLALIALAGASAFVLDEPAAAVVAAVPVTRARRTAVRLVAVLLPMGVWVSSVLALALRHPGTPVRALLTEGVGVLAVAVAGAAALRLAGRDEPGEVAASVLGATLLAVLLFDPPPHSVPMFPVNDGWAASTLLWTGLAAVAIVVVAGTSGSPVSGPRGLRKRSGRQGRPTPAPAAPPAACAPGTGVAVRWARRPPAAGRRPRRPRRSA
jgi:hypothetical protein